MGDLIDSITKWIKERTTSPMYGTFVFSVILWNWEFFYVLFWQNDEKLSVPAIEYVQLNYILEVSRWEHVLYFFVFPLISTYIIVWWLPIVNNWVHKKHLSFYYKKKIIIDEAKLEYEKKQEENLKIYSKIKKDQVEVKKEINKNISDEEKMLMAFNDFKNMKSYHGLMKQVKDSIYDNNGKVLEHDGINWVQHVSVDNLAIADSKKIINILGVGSNRRIELTEKGKFFMEKYLEDIN
jgi:hypothetical protein